MDVHVDVPGRKAYEDEGRRFYVALLPGVGLFQRVGYRRRARRPAVPDGDGIQPRRKARRLVRPPHLDACIRRFPDRLLHRREGL